MTVLDLSAYKPVPSTLGDANQVANGMQAIQNCINALDNNNFAGGKIFDPTKLMQNAAVDGDGLVWDNTNSKWVPASSRKMLPANIAIAAAAVQLNAAQSFTTSVATDLVYAQNFSWTKAGAAAWAARGAPGATVAVPDAGIYLVHVFVQWQLSGAGVRMVQLTTSSALPGTTHDYGTAVSSGSLLSMSNIVGVFNMAAGDTVKVTGQQDSGGSLNALDSHLSIVRIA